ncbi:FAD-linked oxidase C-terminal domain-containing protein [soil metagenome]
MSDSSAVPVMQGRRRVIDALGTQFGSRALFDPEVMLPFLRDQCLIAEHGCPLAVVRAQSINDVQAVMKIASLFSVPVVTRGAGTGLAGGANAVDGCILLSVEKMNRVLSVDVNERLAVVEPGVINAELDRVAAEDGLQYLPDPGSRAISSIGGNIATNAGGMCCAKYGVTKDHIAALKVVLPSGELIRTGSATRKNVTGLDLTGLMVGSEGTLGVIVEATVRLHLRKLGNSTVVMTFGSVSEAIDAVLVVTSSIVPASLEIMDATTIRAVNEFTGMGIDVGDGAVLIATFDGPQGPAEAVQCESIAASSGSVDAFRTDDVDEGLMLMEARRAALPALERLGATLLDDVAVPVPNLPAMVQAIEKQASRWGLVIGTFGHAADGNLHPTIVFDPQDRVQRDAARSAFREIVREALRLGGSVSGEHGIGSLKKEFVEQMYGPSEVALMARVKAAFDPQSLLNPGKSF